MELLPIISLMIQNYNSYLNPNIFNNINPIVKNHGETTNTKNDHTKINNDTYKYKYNNDSCRMLSFYIIMIK